MGCMMQGFIVTWAVDCLFVQNVQNISGAKLACIQLSARGSSGEMLVGHEVDIQRLRMSGTSFPVPYMACTGTTSAFTILLFNIYFDP
jgi:hypothetical protein